MAQLMQEKSSYVSEIEQRVEKKQKEFQLKQQREQMDIKMDKLKERMLEFVQLYGIEDYRTQMLISFHDMALQMKEAVKTFEAINEVTSFMSETIGFIDQSYDMMTDLFMQVSNKRFNVFNRMKNNMLMKKSIKSMQNRMMTISKNMANVQKMSLTMSSSMKIASQMMQKAMQKNSEKNNEKLLKNGQQAVDMSGSPSLKICQEYVNQNSDYEKESGSNQAPSSNGGTVRPDEI